MGILVKILSSSTHRQFSAPLEQGDEGERLHPGFRSIECAVRGLSGFI